jgi:hypothetical protein
MAPDLKQAKNEKEKMVKLQERQITVLSHKFLDTIDAFKKAWR